MRLDQFRELADTWGGDIDRWPEQMRPAARELAATAEGRQVLDQARAFDDLLAQPPVVASERARRVAHAVTLTIAVQEQRRSARWWRRDWLLPAASVACSGIVGVVMALSLPTATVEDPELQSALGMVLDSGAVMTSLEIQ